MTDRMHDTDSLQASLSNLRADDPRLDAEYVRIVDRDEGAPVVLVGVVHDHPASIYRVREFVDTLDPEVLGLELPRVVMPLFEKYAQADEDREDPGGEMSAAIRAAEDADVVGLDMPDFGSLVSLAKRMWREKVTSGTARSIADDVCRLYRHALAGRLVAAGLPLAIVGGDVHPRQRYEVTAADPPAVQAEHERRHVRKSSSLLNSLDLPSATRLIDDERERRIASRLVDLQVDSTSPIVAVVGYQHLDSVVEAMRNAAD